MVVCVLLRLRPPSSSGRRLCCGCCCSPLAWGRNEERNQSRIKFWSVEEIVGELGKRARVRDSSRTRSAEQCSPVFPVVWEQTDTTQIDRSIASINPSIDVSHFSSYLLTHSVSQSVPLSCPPPPPPNTGTDLFIFDIEDLGGKI
jgi:hypothetical protein